MFKYIYIYSLKQKEAWPQTFTVGNRTQMRGTETKLNKTIGPVNNN